MKLVGGSDEAGLQASLAFAQRILQETTTDGLLAFDRDLRYLVWSPVMEQLTGMPAADVLGRNALELFPYLVETGEDARYRDAIAGKRTVSRDRPYRIPKTHREGFYDAHYAPLVMPDGATTGGVAVVREITERKLAERRIEESERRFQIMADSSPVLLWMSRTDSLCTFFNQSWLEFTGRSLEDEWGVGWVEGVHPEDFQRCMDTYVAAFNARRAFEMEYRLRRHDGQYRWILDRGVPRTSADGAFAGFIGSCVDITERKTMEAELREAVRLRDEFLSIASHELRTPLTPLQLQVQSLQPLLRKMPGEVSQAIVGRLELVERQVLRVARLVDTLLDISRLSARRVVFHHQPLDLCDLAREVAARLEHELEVAGCRLRLRAEHPVVGRWDRVRLDQVVSNLLGNAIKYGAGAPVELDVTSGAGRARLVVRDYGIGIAPEHQARIFERFERAVSAEHYGGFGLGLWIVREVVHGLGGEVRVESVPGQGATFTVDLPLAPPSQPSEDGDHGP